MSTSMAAMLIVRMIKMMSITPRNPLTSTPIKMTMTDPPICCADFASFALYETQTSMYIVKNDSTGESTKSMNNQLRFGM